MTFENKLVATGKTVLWTASSRFLRRFTHHGVSRWRTGWAATRGWWSFSAVFPTPVVPDNVKAAVTRSNRYEPQLNRSYQQWAEHYHTAVLRLVRGVRRTRQKSAVLLVSAGLWRVFAIAVLLRWMLNQAIRELLVELQSVPLPENRWQAFVRLDQPIFECLADASHEYAQSKP